MPESTDPDDLVQETEESLDKVRHLVDELKIVQEHEKTVLGEGRSHTHRTRGDITTQG